jgi:hypothetical protein
MTCTKEAKVNSQDSGYSTAPEAMAKFGQMRPPYQALAISLFTQDARTQDEPEAMEFFVLMNKFKNRCLFPRRQRETLKIQATVLRRRLWSNLGRRSLLPHPQPSAYPLKMPRLRMRRSLWSNYLLINRCKNR